VKLINGDDFNLFISLAIKLAVFLVINLHGNFRFAFNYMEIGDQITICVDEEA
jgi:hypothetical protein